MTSEQQDKIHAARQFIVDGRTEEAIAALAEVVAGSEDWTDILLLLKTRHKNLARAILKGTIAREDENLERNGINSALFDLVQAIENELETPKPTPGPAKPVAPVVQPKIEPLPKAPETIAPTAPKVVFGWKLAAGLSVALALLLLFFGKNLFFKKGSNVAVETQKTAPVVVKTVKFSGKTLRPNRQPAPGIQIEIANGLAKTASGADGSFEFSIPEIPEKTVRLVLRRDGKVLMDQIVGLNAAVFAELKVPN